MIASMPFIDVNAYVIAGAFLNCMGVRRGGRWVRTTPPPSPMRGHLHHWNLFFISRTSILHTCTLSTIALTQYR